MNGYTIMELLVAVGIMALFSLTLVSVFLATVRGGGKAQLIQQVHQDGDFVIKRLAREIRAAALVECNGSQATVTDTSGSQTVFSLVNDSGLTRVAAGGSQFLSGTLAEATGLGFTCYSGESGNQVVTISLELSVNPAGPASERQVQEFATSVSTRQR